MRLTLHLRDLSARLVGAWRQEFAGFANVEVSQGDIFSNLKGMIPPGAPIDVTADALVSPANSFGFMDGGIDAVFTYQLGQQVQDTLRSALAARFGGELPVGQAVIVETGRTEIPWLISAPTMRVPMDVSQTTNAYLAMRAALLAVEAHNRSTSSPIRSLLCPGLGTAVGRMPAAICARQMRVAWERVVLKRELRAPTLAHAERDDAMLRGELSE